MFLNHLYHTKTPLPHMGKVTQSIDWIKINLSFVHMSLHKTRLSMATFGYLWAMVSTKSNHHTRK